MKALPSVLLALAAFLAGCAHGRYDDVVAVNAKVLNERTKATLADGDTGRLSLAESRRFLRQSQAQVRTIRARADLCRMSADEVNVLDWLDGEYTALLRRSQPLRTSSGLKLRNSVATLQRLRPVHVVTYVQTTFGGDDGSVDSGGGADASSGHCSGGSGGGGHCGGGGGGGGGGHK